MEYDIILWGNCTGLEYIEFDRLVLRLNCHPDAIELHHCQHIRDRFMVGVLQKWFDLIDAFNERTQAHTATQDGTPPLTQIAQTLTEASAKEHILTHVQQKAFKFRQDREVRCHIMLAVLALERGHLQIIQMTPAGFQASAIMAISRKLLRIRAFALPTLPIDLACLRAHPSWFTPPTGLVSQSPLLPERLSALA